MALPRILVVMPSYNEAATIGAVIARVRAAVPHADILVVDDASPDGTGAIVEALAAQDPAVRVLHRPGKLGLGTAYITGFECALAEGYTVAIEIDADGSHLPEQLPSMLRAVAGGADLALGSRWVPGGVIHGWPRYRQWISRAGTAVTRLVLGSRLRDATSGFRAIRTIALASVPLGTLTSHGYGFQVELAWTLERFGAKIVEVPITFVEREGGRSKMSAAIVLEALYAVLRWGFMRRFRPGRLPTPVAGTPLSTSK